ncbi:hypothetical protein Tco_1502646 [Tanacetum coccineum]
MSVDLPSCDDFYPINIPEEKSVTFSNPLFDSNDDFTSSDDESLSDEDVLEDNDGDIDEINAFLDIDVPTDIKDGYHDSKGDIIYLESFLINDTIPNLPPKVFLDIGLKDEPDNKDLKNMVKDKVFNPDILSSNLLSYRGKITSDFSEISMMIYEGDIPISDVPFLYFYPP